LSRTATLNGYSDFRKYADCQRRQKCVRRSSTAPASSPG